MSTCKRIAKMGWLAGPLVLFLFLSLVHPCTGDSGRETIVVFQGTATAVPYKGVSGERSIHKPRSFHAPALVGGVLDNKDFLAIICGAELRDTSGPIFAEGVAKTSYGNHEQWTEAEVFTNNAERNNSRRIMRQFAAVMKEKKIYVLAISFDTPSKPSTGRDADNGWNPLMIVGTVTTPTGTDVSAASIKWEAGRSLKSIIVKSGDEGELPQFFGGVGKAIVTKNGAIVFPILLSSSNIGESKSSILYSTDDGTTWNVGGNAEAGTTDGSVVEWGDGKLLYVVAFFRGYRRAYESDNMGTTWKESLMFSRVWGNDGSRTEYGRQGSAIKAPVDEKDVLLFAHPLSENGGSSTDTLQLWLSDGQRIVRVGTISDTAKERQTGNSILSYVGDRLYITHEINPFDFHVPPADQVQQWDGVIGLTPLPEFFASAKTTVRAWRALDTKYKAKGVPTEWLVGFLGNAKDQSVWEDIYKCVDANVKGGESVDGGFRFSGQAERGAEWPVSSQGQNQVYAFTEKQFTLAATVRMHAAKDKGQFSLLGASLDSVGNDVLVGLGYTHDNKWYAANHENKEIKTTDVFEWEKEYHVALTFANGKAFVYVDGVDIVKKELITTQTALISHFYMGGTGQSSSTPTDSACTVKNVMLFNRALEQNEVAELTKVAKDSKLHEPIPTTESNKKSEGDKKEPTKEAGGDKGEKTPSVAKKGTNDGTVVSLSFIAWICLVCSMVIVSVF